MELSLYEVLYAVFLQLQSRKERGIYFHALSDEAYETLLLLEQGNFKVLVAERTREQRNAVVRYWRQSDSLHVGPQFALTLYVL